MGDGYGGDDPSIPHPSIIPLEAPIFALLNGADGSLLPSPRFLITDHPHYYNLYKLLFASFPSKNRFFEFFRDYFAFKSHQIRPFSNNTLNLIILTAFSSSS